MMKSQKLVVLFAFCAVLLYFSSLKSPESAPVISDEQNNTLTVVLKDEHDFLVPLTLSSNCTDEIGCLNESLSCMSTSMMGLSPVIPKYAQILSVECDESCVIDFTEEILQFLPSRQSEIEQVLSVLLESYENIVLQVEGEPCPFNLESDVYLNQVHLIEKDYSKGHLYQMYMTKQFATEHLLVPVTIYAASNDPISVIEQFYSMMGSVQFDNIHWGYVQIEEGDPWRLCLRVDHKTDDIDNVSILGILHSLKRHTNAQEVEIVVNDVVVDKIVLDELLFNQIHLSDTMNIVYNINGD